MKRYQLYIFDLDGTIYRGAEAIPNAAKVVGQLRSEGAKIRYLTNNSGQTQQFYKAKLDGLGFPCTVDEIYSSATGSAKHCREIGVSAVYYVGEPGLRETLELAGIRVVNQGDEPASPAEAVVAGICRSFTYRWLGNAMQQIKDGAKFIGANTDATYPVEDGKEDPGAGAIVAAIRTCSGREPFVVGKPNPYLVELVLKESGVSPAGALAVGDRYETDILSGKNAGVDTHLVLTGVTQKAPEGQSWSPDLLGLL